jgi:hypothetical protein
MLPGYINAMGDKEQYLEKRTRFQIQGLQPVRRGILEKRIEFFGRQIECPDVGVEFECVAENQPIIVVVDIGLNPKNRLFLPTDETDAFAG